MADEYDPNTTIVGFSTAPRYLTIMNAVRFSCEGGELVVEYLDNVKVDDAAKRFFEVLIKPFADKYIEDRLGDSQPNRISQ